MPDRFNRQRDLVRQHRLQQLTLTIIGVGAIGRTAALQAAALGTGRLQLIDFDVVEATNLTTQGYRQCELGQAKVLAAASAVRELDPEVEIECIADRFRPQLTTGNIVMCCVDSIAARRTIWRSIRPRPCLWIDGRLLGEVIRVLVADTAAERAGYENTLFDPRLAQRGSCGAQGTLYTASIAAGLMLHQLARWTRGAAVDCDTLIDLPSADLIVDPQVCSTAMTSRSPRQPFATGGTAPGV